MQDWFGEHNMNCGKYLGLNWTRSGWIWLQVMLLLTVYASFKRPNIVLAEEREAVAVMPLRVHAMKPLDYLGRGLQRMLTLCIGKRGLHVISPEVINGHLSAFIPHFEMKALVRVGEQLGADWIVSGSLTQIGRKVSLDLKVIDITARRPPFSIYMVAEDVDVLPDVAERIAVSVDHHISGVVYTDAVRVTGNQRIEEEAILALVRTKPGEKLDYDLLDKDLRDIYKMGFFEDVKTEVEDGPTGAVVTFGVTEKPSIARLVFEGNEKVDDRELKKELGIKLYSILDLSKIRQSINRLKDYYRQKGYYNVDIREKVKPLPNNEVLLTYEIEEHEKVYITKIQFSGNTNFDDDKLKGIMETGERGFFSWLTDSGYLDLKKLEFDTHKITSFYHNNGFVKARVGEPRISYEKGKGLTITIEIDEGHKYNIRNVLIEGDLIRPVDELLEKVRIGKGDVFNREIVRRDVLTLRSVCADEGYASAEVIPLTREDHETHLVDITYRIKKGQKVRFERVNILGNTVTRDKVIRRELKVVEGGYFSGKALRRSTQNLHRLGFFEDVGVQTKKGSQEDLIVLNVNVKERPTGLFSIGAGYSSVEGNYVVFQLAQNNLFGHGQRLTALAKIGGESSQFDIKFVEPWLLGKNISAGIDIFKWENEYDEYTKDSLGGALSLGFPLHIDDFTRGSVRYAYEDADVTEIAEHSSITIKDMEGRTVTSSVTLAVKRDSRDRLWNPSRGSINSLTFEYAGGLLGGDAYFRKYLARSAWFFPLFWETVFLVQGRWGYVKRGSGGELPVYQKFRLGGLNSVRGFEFGDISPVDPVTGDRIGGEKMMVYNFEYRFPLFEEQGVVGLVFFDAGNVFTEDEDYSFGGIRKSTGVGIRWYSPIGPLRMEYGKNLDPQGDEPSDNWEFSVGGLF